jgi:hypothetical protein
MVPVRGVGCPWSHPGLAQVVPPSIEREMLVATEYITPGRAGSTKISE